MNGRTGPNAHVAAQEDGVGFIESDALREYRDVMPLSRGERFPLPEVG